jgi:hypothetical protein
LRVNTFNEICQQYINSDGTATRAEEKTIAGVILLNEHLAHAALGNCAIISDEMLVPSHFR